MSNKIAHIVYTDGPQGRNYPYGVFTNRQAAEAAREALIKNLDSKKRDFLSDNEQTLAHELTGTLDAQVKIKECELREEFTGDDLDDLFEDYD